MSAQALLGQAPSRNSSMLLGAVVGTCFAVAVASTSATSLHVTPAVSQVTNVVSQPLFYAGTGQFPSATVGAAPADNAEMEYEVISGAQPRSWAPLATLVAAPLAVLGAVLAFRPSRKVAIDPIDMTTTSGTQWSMVASAGEAAVARNYATALVELAQEAQSLEQIHSDMDAFGSMLEDSSLTTFFNNPLFAGDKQKELVAKICEESGFSPITKNFLSFLVDKKRMPQIPAIIREFDEQFYDVTGTQVATVTAAVPLSEDQLRLIANKLHEMTKGKNIKIKSQVDSNLLAGFVLEYGKSGSQRIDLSLRGQLNELESELKDGIRQVLSAGVPAGVQVMAAAIGVNALLAGSASAGGNIFDFGLTMPIQMIQFLLLMVFLEKTVFTPVGKMIDERADYIRKKQSVGADNSKEIAALNAKAEELLAAARKEAAQALDKAKKEANAQGAQKLAKAKAEMDSTLKRSLSEVQRSKADLWNKLEEEVLPVLADDIVNKLLAEEAAAAAAKQ